VKWLYGLESIQFVKKSFDFALKPNCNKTIKQKRMNKFIKNIIAFSLKNKAFTFIWVAILAVAGFISFKNMPIEAFPDVTNTIVIITQWNGRSAEEVERFVTTPIELAMSPVQKKTSVRSTTMFGLSIVKILFEDGVDDIFARIWSIISCER
jgi:cobalt-zinc-cadmium resistance protein CzcA